MAKKVFIWGNHDSNLLHENGRMLEDIRAAVTKEWGALRDGILKDWKIVGNCYSHDSVFRLGQVTFQHGCVTGKSQNLSHLHKQGVQYGVPHGLHVSAHTHSAVAVSQMQWLDQPMPYYVANTGTGADWEKMYYMNRASKALWSRGLVRGTVSESAVRNNDHHFASPQWTAETLFHSHASQHKHDVRLRV